MTDKAVLNGINNYRKISDLRGCVNDTRSLRALLVDDFGFRDSEIRTRHDGEVTKDRVNRDWNWLIRDAQPGDRLVFHFSGHGSYIPDQDDEEHEADAKDELLCLYGMDWYDADTYLTDDEIAKWTRQIPSGVHVTFILDCCHSGTGTRMIEPPADLAARSDTASAAARAIVGSIEERSRALSRSVSQADIVPESWNEVGKATRLARFAKPPAKLEAMISANAKTRSIRGAIAKHSRSRSSGNDQLNHVLWAGCRDNQTSADAYIDDDFHGAFTRHFCKAARRSNQCDDIIRDVRSTLLRDAFDQVPQLEPDGHLGTLFGKATQGFGQSSQDSSPTYSTGNPPNAGQSGIGSASSEILHTLYELSDQITDLTRRVHRAESEGKLNASMSEGSRGSDADRSLVYLHGICKHKEGYSLDWFNAMRPHLDEPLASMLEDRRREILWSKHVSDMSRSASSQPLVEDEQKLLLEAELIASLEERQLRERTAEMMSSSTRSANGEITDLPRGGATRALFGIPGLDCIDDFMKYLLNNRIRRDVIAEATSVLQQELRRGREIEFISHSWGTVVAYEALHELSAHSFPGRVRNWFTVGAALSISAIAKRINPRGGMKPRLVDRWINLDTTGDPVGGSVAAVGMQVDNEYLGIKPDPCEKGWLGYKASCAHGAYFKRKNTRVNRDIFAHYINGE